jgi:dihydrodipicolinate synthase/N-acetylneuraminate lyase
MKSFKGVVAAPMSPMTAAGDVDEAAFARVLEFNLQAGIHGFWLAGGSGESIMLDDDENKRLATVAAEVVGDRGLSIMHVGSPTTRRSAAMAEHAASVGVDAICCVPPFFYQRTDEEIVEHYRVVAAAADLPLFAYNLPHMTGVEITVDLMRKIADAVPQLRGLKHSAANFGTMMEFLAMDLDCFIGNCTLLLPALAAGAVGCVDGPPNMAPEVYVEIWNAFHDGDLEHARDAQQRGILARDILIEFGAQRFHSVLKAVVAERIGLDNADPRPPALPLSPQERAHVLAKAAALGLTPVAVNA